MGFSIIHIFMESSLVVKCIIIFLLGVSVWSWAFAFSKWTGLRYLSGILTDFEVKMHSYDLMDISQAVKKPVTQLRLFSFLGYALGKKPEIFRWKHVENVSGGLRV